MNLWRYLLSALILLVAVGLWGRFRMALARHHMRRGVDHLRQHRPLEAIRELQEATTDLGREPEVWYYLARAFSQAGDFSDGRDALARALRADPDHGPSLELLQKLRQAGEKG
jgi:predicted Zn-dependent protease